MAHHDPSYVVNRTFDQLSCVPGIASQLDEGCRTNISGVYAAGDVTTGSNRMRQLVTAAAEGAIAAESLYEDLKSRPLEF